MVAGGLGGWMQRGLGGACRGWPWRVAPGWQRQRESCPGAVLGLPCGVPWPTGVCGWPVRIERIGLEAQLVGVKSRGARPGRAQVSVGVRGVCSQDGSASWCLGVQLVCWVCPGRAVDVEAGVWVPWWVHARIVRPGVGAQLGCVKSRGVPCWCGCRVW